MGNRNIEYSYTVDREREVQLSYRATNSRVSDLICDGVIGSPNLHP